MKRIVLSSITFLLILTIYSTTTSFAEDDININRWIVNAVLFQNGDLNISEDITLTFAGNPSRVYKNIVFKKLNKIENLSLYELIDGEEVLYERVKTAGTGDTNKFTLKQNKDNVSLKIFSLSATPQKTFRLKYTLKNIGTIHSDTAELYYSFLSTENKIDIDYFSIDLQLPGFDKDRTKIFIHGPIESKIYFLDEAIRSEIRNIKGGESIENRILFPKEYLKLSTNKGDSDFDSIVEEENVHLLKVKQLIQRKKLRKKDFSRFSIPLILLKVFILLFLFYKFKKNSNFFKNKASS